jgi:general secretion pathway protein K
MKYIRKNSGIALVQVLLMSAIISIFALYLTSTAKSQVQQARWINDKMSALVALHDVEIDVIFRLLTQDKGLSSFNKNIDDQLIQSKWNFYGKAFKANENVDVKIQDQSGLLHIQYPDVEFFKKLFLSNGYSEEASIKLIDNLLDWQDLDSIPRAGSWSVENSALTRNGPVPFIEDLIHIAGVDSTLIQILKNNTTLYRTSYFNPTNSPETLLSAITTQEAAEQVILLRDARQLTKQKFEELTGIKEGDFIFFYPANFFMIELQSTVNDATVKKTMFVEISPYAIGEQAPVNILMNSR